jgi:hypothetical protein
MQEIIDMIPIDENKSKTVSSINHGQRGVMGTWAKSALLVVME